MCAGTPLAVLVVAAAALASVGHVGGWMYGGFTCGHGVCECNTQRIDCTKRNLTSLPNLRVGGVLSIAPLLSYLFFVI